MVQPERSDETGSSRGRVDSPDVLMPPVSTYLDLDGDGVPDAVQTSQTVGYDTTRDGAADRVETMDEVASKIGIDGVPHHVELTQTIEADADDGSLEVIDVAAFRRARGRRFRRAQPSGFALARVRPTELGDALERVTRFSSAEGDVRVTVEPNAVGLTVHSPEAGWWAATAARARMRRGSSVVVTVDRVRLRVALADAAITHRRGAPLVVSVGEGLWIGDHVVAPVRERDRQVVAPPYVERWEPLERGVMVPTVVDDVGETTYPFVGGTITTRNTLLRVLAGAGIARIDVFEADGRVFLLGSSDEHPAVRRVVVTGEARVHYR